MRKCTFGGKDPRDMDDRNRYDAFRPKYNAASLPSEYDETKVTVETKAVNSSW